MGKSNIKVVLVSGHSQNGKDELFKQAGAKSGYVRLAFADKLKEVTKDLFQLTDEQVHGKEKDEMDLRYPNLIDPKRIKRPGILGKLGFTVENPDYKPFLTPRRILQILGQNLRALNPDIWVDYIWNNTIPWWHTSYKTKKFMVTDLRFPNEVKKSKVHAEQGKHSLQLFRVIRPGVFASSGANDISETALDSFTDWDEVILNDKDLKHLKAIGLKALKKKKR